MMKNLKLQICGKSKRKQSWEAGSTQKRNYQNYRFAPVERIFGILLCSGVVLFFAIFFYRSILASIVLSPIGFFLFQQLRQQAQEKQRSKLSMQFKECILCVAANLRAGYSAENAFCQSIADMTMLFGEKSLIIEELLWIKQGLQNNFNLEELLLDLGERSGLEDLQEFAEVFAIAKRGGGNLPAIITDAAVILSDKLEMQKEIQVLISGKQLEQKVMSVIPFGIVCYVEITTTGYFDILYGNFVGIAVMSLCLGIYVTAYVMAQKITNFKVKGG